MQVKRRINRFFGNILRKENQETEENQVELPKSKKKSSKKNNHSYSQWDLMEHIAVDTGRESQIIFEEKSIYSDGLALDSLEEYNEEYHENELEVVPKRKSFFKRSGSLLRRSMRRSSRKVAVNQNQNPETFHVGPGSLANIVKQINETLIEVAGFSGDISENRESNDAPSTPLDSSFGEDSIDPFMEDLWHNEQCTEIIVTDKKPGIKNGLKRQASKLASKFQRTSGSMRLKTATSIDSFPKSSVALQRSASFTTLKKVNEQEGLKRGSSLRRKLSFKVR